MSQTLTPAQKKDFAAGAEWLRYHLLNHAEITFGRILKDAPDHLATRHLWGVSLVKLGRLEQGIEALRTVVAGVPNNAKVQQDLAAALQRAGDGAGARDAWSSATAGLKPMPQGHSLLA